MGSNEFGQLGFDSAAGLSAASTLMKDPTRNIRQVDRDYLVTRPRKIDGVMASISSPICACGLLWNARFRVKILESVHRSGYIVFRQ